MARIAGLHVGRAALFRLEVSRLSGSSFIERFECTVEPSRDHVVVHPKGELDLATVPQVDRQVEELVAAGFKRIVLDLSGLSFVDSTGLRLFVKWSQAAAADGLAFSFLPGNSTVERVLDVSGLRDALDFADPAKLRRGP